MPKKRAKRRESVERSRGTMSGLRRGLKGVVGGKKERPAWVDWVWWVVLGVAVAILLARALS